MLRNLSTLSEDHKRLLEWRGVDTPCTRCSGAGVRAYSNTSTWHGGMGGNMFTNDVCDACWGTGDEHRKGVNLREFTAQRAAWEADQCLQYLGQRLGTNLGGMKLRIAQLASLCDAQERKRKIPEGQNEFWWAHQWHALASILRKLIAD